MIDVEIELKDSVKQKIDEIVKDKSFHRATELANSYLGNQKTLPELFRPISNLAEAYKKLIEVPAQLNPKTKDMRGRIYIDTLQAIEREYSKQTLNKILQALIVFGVVLEGSPVKVINDDIKKAFLHFKNKHQAVTDATKLLLKKAGLSDPEKEVIQGIKSRHEGHLKRLSQYKKVTLDPIQETLFNFGATRGPLKFKPEIWTREYLNQSYSSFIFKKPHGRPSKNVILQALEIVIYRLLGKKDKRVKERYCLTAKIINQCLKTNLKAKDIDNALHSS